MADTHSTTELSTQLCLEPLALRVTDILFPTNSSTLWSNGVGKKILAPKRNLEFVEKSGELGEGRRECQGSIDTGGGLRRWLSW